MIHRCKTVEPRCWGASRSSSFPWPVVRARASGGTTDSKLARTTALLKPRSRKAGSKRATPASVAGRHDNACWWTAFGDPTLNQLVAEASQQNLTLKMAGCRILQARAERGIAEGNLFPQQQSMTAPVHPQCDERKLLSVQHHHLARATITTTGRPASMPLGNSISGGVSAARSRPPTPTSTPRWRATTTSWCSCKPRWPQTTSKCGPTRSVWNSPGRTSNSRRKRSGSPPCGNNKAWSRNSTFNRRPRTWGRPESLIPTLQTGCRTAQNRLCILMGEPPHLLAQRIKSPGTIPAPPQEVIVGIPAELLRRRPDVRQAEREAAAQSARIGIAEVGVLSPHRHHRHDRAAGRAPEPVVRIRAAWSARSVPA